MDRADILKTLAKRPAEAQRQAMQRVLSLPVVVIANPRMPLERQRPYGYVLQFKRGRAVFAPFLLRGWSRKFCVVNVKESV